MKTMIIVHCSDTYPSQDIGAADIRKWHVKERGWLDIGYNLIIRRNGDFEGGRDLDGDGDYMEEQGAHTFGFNKRSIGICMIGGKGRAGRPEANFTLEQYTALKEVIKYLRVMYPIVSVMGHRDVLGVTKVCPCFDVKQLIGDV